MRWKFSLMLFAIGIVAWLGAMVAHPYTAGRDPEILRPSVAAISVNFAIASILILIATALVAYWNAEHRRSWRAITFGAILAFFLGTAVARLIWLEFIVLG